MKEYPTNLLESGEGPSANLLFPKSGFDTTKNAKSVPRREVMVESGQKQFYNMKA